MRFIGIAIVVFLKILCIQCRMLPIEYMTRRPMSVGDDNGPELAERAEARNEKVVELRKSYDESEEYPEDGGRHGRRYHDKPKNRILPIEYMTRRPTSVGDDNGPELAERAEAPNEKVVELRTSYDESEEYPEDGGRHGSKYHDKPKNPCGVMVLSNMPNMQSLLRKYRYDANGVLIPSSVKYFIKLPQGLQASPILVPLNEKAYSPLGGFVRYYKEVPPIPRAW